MEQYTPNFKDPRVRRRCEKALAWLRQHPTKTPTKLSTRLIDRYLGHQGNPLSLWLREQLLICVDSHFNYLTGKCKTYISNEAGITELTTQLNPQQPKFLSQEQEQQLSTGDIAYQEVSDRLFNPLQFIPTVVRKPLMTQRGYRYNYDIKCAAPTLISEQARVLGLEADTPWLSAYIQDRTAQRQLIAQQCHLTTDQVKQVINALLNGARLSCNYQSSIWHIIEQDHVKYQLLKNNEIVQGLKDDFRKCWQIIEKDHEPEYITDKRGHVRKKPFGSKSKSGVYRKLELQLIKEIQRYMKKNKIRCLLMHDGWTCDTIIDPIILRNLIKTKMGFNIDIDVEIWEYV